MIPHEKGRLRQIVERFPGQSILVVGDLMLDQFIWGQVDRISPEAPVPVVEVTKETFHLGGAANVASNLAVLGGKPRLVGIVGKDGAGQQVLEALEDQGIGIEGVVRDPSRMTTVKTRILAQNQQVCRTDRESKSSVDQCVLGRLGDLCDRFIGEANGIILSDYSKGVLSKELVQDLVEKSVQSEKFLAVDPRMSDFTDYQGACAVTPNKKEAEYASGVQIVDEASLAVAGQTLLSTGKLDCLLITRGEEGMSLFENQAHSHISAVAREVFDVTGAGDTVVSLLTLGVAAGASIREAAILANHAAGVVVGKLGTAAASSKEILTSVEKSSPDYA